MREFTDVAVRAFAADDDGRLAFFAHAQGVGDAGEIVIHGGAIEVHAIGHAEPKTFCESPTAFGVHDSAGFDFVLGDNMVDGAAEFFVAAGVNIARTAETELNEVNVVDVQVKETAAKLPYIGGFAG